MKRIIILVLSVVLIFNLAGCGGEEIDKESIKDDLEVGSQETGVQEDEEDSAIEVEKKLMSVKVTLPVSMLELGGEEINYDEITEDAKEEGIKDVTVNDDGSITYSMSKSKHKEMMNEMKGDLIESINDIVADEDFASIEDIVANNSFTEFDMIVNKEKFENSFDGFAAMGLAMQSMFYQLFDGVDPDDYKAIINVKDEATGKLIDTVIYPDVFDE